MRSPRTPTQSLRMRRLRMPSQKRRHRGERPKPSPSRVEELEAQLHRLESALEKQQQQLDQQAKTIAQQGQTIAETSVEVEEQKDFRVDLSGSYRMRGYVFGAKWGAEKPVTGGLFRDQPTAGKMMDQRLRLGMAFRYKKVASAHVMFQAQHDVESGDNNDVTRTAQFADNPSITNRDGIEAPNVSILRAWTEFRVPVGLIRVGRQSSHWGLGILANHGDGFDDDFGENRYHTSFDRFLFGTNPVSIIQTLTGKGGKEIPITLAVAVDRLVEDPLTQFYGYECEAGVFEADDPERYDERCDVNDDGVTDLQHGYSEERDPSSRPADWWVDQRDDVMEMVYALIYRGKQIRYFGGVGDLTAGAYVIHRTQKETDSQAVIIDGYLDAKVHGVGVQFEGVGIVGRTRAIGLLNSTSDDPLKRANIAGYVARVFYEQPYWKILMESGMASGDNSVMTSCSGPLAVAGPQHQPVAMQEVIARVTRASGTTTRAACAATAASTTAATSSRGSTPTPGQPADHRGLLDGLAASARRLGDLVQPGRCGPRHLSRCAGRGITAAGRSTWASSSASTTTSGCRWRRSYAKATEPTPARHRGLNQRELDVPGARRAEFWSTGLTRRWTCTASA